MNDPDFVREREAWYTAGLDSMSMGAAIVVLVFSAVVGFAAVVFDFDGQRAAILLFFLNWIGIGLGYWHFKLGARRLARRGEVIVDRF